MAREMRLAVGRGVRCHFATGRVPGRRSVEQCYRRCESIIESSDVYPKM